MPLYMDVHSLDGAVTGEEVGKAPRPTRKPRAATTSAFALLGGWGAREDLLPLRGNHRDAVATVHRVAHRLLAGEIYQVQEGS